MAWLHRYSIRHPVLVVTAAVVITLAVAPGAARLKLRTDGHALVPAGAPQVRHDQSIRSDFDAQDPIVVLIRSNDPEGIFNSRTLRLVQDLTAAFQQIEGIRASGLFSLATERGGRVFTGTTTVRRFLEPLPETRTQLDQLRSDLQKIRLYNRLLVSKDEKATAIFVGVPPGADRLGLYRTIQDIIAAKDDIPEEIHVIGAPVAEALLGNHILEDLGVPLALLGHSVPRGNSTWSWPGSFDELRLLIGRRIGLVPIVFAVMGAVLLVGFRSASAMMLPLTEVAAALVVVFGLMGWFDVPVYLTIAVLPVILTATGVTDEIHVFSCYRQKLRHTPPGRHAEAVKAAMDEMYAPVLKTSVTTAVGFASFALSPMAPVRVFGIFATVGMIFCMLWSLSVIPALLVLIPPRRSITGHWRDEQGDRTRVERWLGRLASAVARWRYVVLAVAVAATVAAPFAVRRVMIQDSWIDGFAPSSEFYRATQQFNEQFLGAHILLVCADAQGWELKGELAARAVGSYDLTLPADQVSDPKALVGQRISLRLPDEAAAEVRPTSRPDRRSWSGIIETASRKRDGVILTTRRLDRSPKSVLGLSGNETLHWEIKSRPLMSPDVLGHLRKLETAIEARSEDQVGGVIGPAAYVETTNYILRAWKEENRRIPDDIQGVENTWKKYEEIRGADRLHQVVDQGYRRALITVFMTNANFIDTARLMSWLRDYEHDNLAPHAISLSFAGDVAVSQTLIDAIVTTQVRSLLTSLLGIAAVTAILGRSLAWGLYCMVPCGLAVLVNFAVMGLVEIPLGVATSMFAGMTLGVGVDYAIHLLERVRLARSRGLKVEAAVTDAMAATGPAIVIDALAVALGFGVMILSQVPANARLGGLLAVSLAGCLVATLLILPALLRFWQPGLRAMRPLPPPGDHHHPADHQQT